MNKEKSDMIKLILSMIIFGTIGILRKYMPYPSSVIALVRGLVGLVFLLVLHWCKKEKFVGHTLKKNGLVLCASGILLGANWIFLFEAIRLSSVAVATMCYYMAPVFVLFASALFLHEAITIRKGVCMLVAVIGMVMVSGVLETGFSGLTGVLLGLGAAMMYAAVIIINKLIKEMTASDRTLFQLGAAALSMLPYVLLTENISALEISGCGFVLLAVAGIVHTGIAYALYFGSLKTVPAQTAALFSYIDPVVAVILSVVVLREQLSLLASIGVVFVLGATILSEVQIKKMHNERTT